MNTQQLIDLLKLGSFEEQNVRVAVFDEEARFLFVSTTMFGFTEDYLGMSVYDYYKGHLSESEIKKVKKCFAKALAGEVGREQIILTNRLNRESITWDVEFNPFVDDEGNKRVLSQIRPHEVNLTTSSTNFFIREMVEQSSDIFTVFDKDYNFVYVSKADATWNDRPLVGQNIKDVVSGKNLKKFYQRAERAKKSVGEIITDTVFIEVEDDEESVFECSMEYHDFNQLGHFFLDRTADVTERFRRNREIDSQKATIDKMSKWTALGQMAANIAHEVNNPLAIIELQVQAIERRGEKITSDQLLEKIRSIGDQKNRIANIVSSLNIYSQDDRSMREMTSLSSIIHDSIALFKTGLVDESLRIVFSNDADSDLVTINSSEVIQVLINLFNNSHDAIAGLKEQWIEINLLDDTDHVIVEVLDSGQGIEKEIAQKIFNRFYTTKSKEKGTGLGLNISREIIMDHGGTLTYDPDSEYTTFMITLPKSELL
ncbi:ATP-binding protein [Halobacteriovorax sp. RZ-1]|uniref:PAS domain-containing sensor histidine kinase n=1 Tax=unclassified Halobacteriovorax TaxID=2639665 RepID=UPI00371347AB